MSAMRGTVILIQHDPYQEKLLSAGFLACNLTVRRMRRSESIFLQIHQLFDEIRGPVMICADLAAIAREGMMWPRFARLMQSVRPNVGLLATQSCHLQPADLARQWVRVHGAMDLLGRATHLRWLQSIRPFLLPACEFFDTNYESKQLQAYAISLLSELVESDDRFARLQLTWSRLEALGQSPHDIAARLRQADGVESKDRFYHLRRYPDCFLGDQACAWIADRVGVGNAQAEDIGNLILKLNLFYHVAKQQPFRDGHFFYRFFRNEPLLAKMNLDNVISDSQELRGFEVKDRFWHGVKFPNSFVGDEAVKWLSTFYGLSTEAALELGQILHDIFQFRHVAEEHDFVDQHFFYRLTINNRVVA